MYHTFEEEVFLAPETIISGVLEAAAFDDLQLTDPEPTRQSGHAAAAASNADADNGEPAFVRMAADPIDAWSRHARCTSGFGG
jgi:hypothetical protein